MSFRFHSEIQNASGPRPIPPRVPQVKPSSLVEKIQEMNIEGIELFGGLGDAVSRLMVIAKFVCAMNCFNYMMSNIQKLTMCLLLEGDQWRAHQRQVFHYEDGAWIMVSSLAVRGWDLLLALEGLFVQLSTSLDDQELQVSWTWHDVKTYMKDIVGDMVEGGLNVMQVLTDVAKSNSDHVRVKTGTRYGKLGGHDVLPIC